MSDTATQSAPHFSGDELQAYLKDGKNMPLLVDFYAEWCGPCKLAAPIIDKLSVEYKGKVTIAKLDTDENNEMARQFGVMSIPTVIIFKNTTGDDKAELIEVDRKIGYGGEEAYRELLKKLVGEK